MDRLCNLISMDRLCNLISMDRLCNLSLKTKKRWTNVSTGLFFLFGGIEYAIIMPTVYLYIQELGGNPSFLGLVLSAFSFTGLLAAPIFGILQDKYHNTKVLVLVANMFEIVGNFMYFMGINLMMLLGSRLVAGIGAGVGSSLFAQIARTTTESERAAAISMAMAARQIGLLFGPGLNLFLKDLDFYFLSFKVDAYSSAGLFMCILWILLQVFIFFFYFDLPPLSEEEQKRDSSSQNSNSNISNKDSEPQHLTRNKRFSESVNVLISGRPKNTKNNNKSVYSQSLPAAGISGSFEEGGVINIAPMWGSSTIVGDARPRAFSTLSYNRELINPSDHVATKQDVMENVDLDGDDLYDPPELPVYDTPELPGLGSGSDDEEQKNGSSGYGSTAQSVEKNDGTSVRTWQEEYLREEIVVLLASAFIFFFNQTVLETALTPMTQRLLNFGELENSILYCICGVEVVIGFIVVKYLSKFISDRVLLLTGFIIELISVVWLLIFYPNASPDEPRENIAWALIGILGVVAGLPFLMVAGITLFSKLTSIETQGHHNYPWMSIGIIVQVSGLASLAVSIISLYSKMTDAKTQDNYSFNLMWFGIGFVIEVSGLAALAVSIISLYSKVTSMDTQDDVKTNRIYLTVSAFIDVAGLPFLAVAIISLYSKITSKKTQGFSQGIRRAVGGLATIMGPLWAGATVEMGYVMFGVMTFLFAFIIMLMLLSWQKLEAPADRAKKADKTKANLVPSLDDDETSPLLINADDNEIET